MLSSGAKIGLIIGTISATAIATQDHWYPKLKEKLKIGKSSKNTNPSEKLTQSNNKNLVFIAEDGWNKRFLLH